MTDKVIATPQALALIEALRAQHGEMLFLQSGGCCDNSAPTCLLPHEITPGPNDVLLGHIGGCPFYMTASQYAYWQNTQLIIDVIDGDSGNLSLDSGTGRMFLTRSRLLDD